VGYIITPEERDLSVHKGLTNDFDLKYITANCAPTLTRSPLDLVFQPKAGLSGSFNAPFQSLLKRDEIAI
jgi:hypothetical protein